MTQRDQHLDTPVSTFEISTDEPVSQTVVDAMAEVTDVQPVSTSTTRREPVLDPLYTAIDPDALDALFQPRVDGTPRTDGQVSFRYFGHDVTVDSDGFVTISPVDTHHAEIDD